METFRGRNLRGAEFRACDLSDAVMRAVDVAGAEIDSPWLLEEPGNTLVVNGVDVAPYVDAELDRRFPGRELRRASDPEGLREAWAALERRWDDTQRRAAALPGGSVDVSIEGEWSFAQTLRHLVMATDTWLGKAVLSKGRPFHPLGLANTEDEDEEAFSETDPSYDDVLAVRAERQAMVRDFIAGASSELLAEQRANPHAPEHAETVLSCLHTIIEEEWEHHRYAVRDLDAVEDQQRLNGPVR